MTTSDHPQYGISMRDWEAARPWDLYLATIEDKKDIWHANWKRATVDEESAARFKALPDKRRVLVLTEDWCGDAARSVPVIAKAFEGAPLVDARYLGSDEHPHALSRYLTHGGRAIPIVIVEDDLGRELGAWGPRPAPLQAIYRARRRAMGPPTKETMSELYAPVMRWYAEDGGKTIHEEILMLLERGGSPR